MFFVYFLIGICAVLCIRKALLFPSVFLQCVVSEGSDFSGGCEVQTKVFCFLPLIEPGPSTGEPGAVEIQSQDSAPQNLFDSMCMTVDASNPVCQ